MLNAASMYPLRPFSTKILGDDFQPFSKISITLWYTGQDSPRHACLNTVWVTKLTFSRQKGLRLENATLPQNTGASHTVGSSGEFRM